MMAALAAALGKDFRLLLRDRVGLIFLTIAPLVVITVAGFSLASLYGADPQGETAYDLPVADLDGGRMGRALRAQLADQSMVHMHVVDGRDTAVALVRRQEAGVALVIPAGASRALAAGRPIELELLTDPVKYLEVANVRAVVQELRHGIERTARNRAARRLTRLRARLTAARADFERAAASVTHELDALPARLAAAEAEVKAKTRSAEASAAREVRAAVSDARELQLSLMSVRLAAELAPLQRFVYELETAQAAFTRWMASVRKHAGRYADRIPPPPDPPVIPRGVAELAHLDARTLIERVASTTRVPPLRLDFPQLPSITPPTLPTVTLPTLPDLPPIRLAGNIELAETSVTGAPQRLNTFDQNVPGFSVTFLLLGMLFGVSLALLDERDWGTLARLRTMPVSLDVTLIAKLLARFTVGVVQMILLLIVGWLLFGISLGPEPWALLLPTAGIVFAGTAFGLVVAGLAHSREAVLPLGSIVIVTMAAVGGCWWPIDLEPHWMQRVALAFPTTWAMAAYNDLMIRRQSMAAVLRPTAILLAYGIAYLVVGLALFRHRAREAR